ncbi:hypothetical protein [Bradyrhizobium sp. LHD-71]|uniref:hypothetical protein n=1 Tax=Bradyrhizobium sp. LHD-71 TaxID=3072141 RepID=UPI00280E84BB|nr:hypothetical protein [Bradyrhizobium sp. LHD-71]MDQ8728513.1 hypothetical protein [Bradyrhizobium sp. LHD-71]
MSDDITRVYRCTSCNGALARTPDDDVLAPSIDSRGVETEAREFVCDECWARLASEHERIMSAQGAFRRRA